MYGPLKEMLQTELEQRKKDGLYKEERNMTTRQRAGTTTTAGEEVVKFCANNYLGRCSDPCVMEAAKNTIDTYGYGMSSVRFICGTQTIHKKLEERISECLGMEDTILYAAAFDANAGVFEPLFGPRSDGRRVGTGWGRRACTG